MIDEFFKVKMKSDLVSVWGTPIIEILGVDAPSSISLSIDRAHPIRNSIHANPSSFCFLLGFVELYFINF